MKTITKKEWDSTPEEYKRVYEGTPYLLCKERDGKVYFGPVKIIGKEKINPIKKFGVFGHKEKILF